MKIVSVPLRRKTELCAHEPSVDAKLSAFIKKFSCSSVVNFSGETIS